MSSGYNETFKDMVIYDLNEYRKKKNKKIWFSGISNYFKELGKWIAEVWCK